MLRCMLAGPLKGNVFGRKNATVSMYEGESHLPCLRMLSGLLLNEYDNPETGIVFRKF